MKYLLSLFVDESGRADMTPEEGQAVMARWDAYTQETRETGAFLGGEGLQPSETATTVRVTSGTPEITDGPFAETKEQLGGFYLLECKDLDEAIAWAKKIPFEDGSIEVRPVMDYDAAGSQEHTSSEVTAS